MDSNPLLSALQNNYGDGSPPPTDTSTVKGLLIFCKQWLDGTVETEALQKPCELMANRLEEGANVSADNLEANEQIQEEQAANLERNIEAYRAIADVLHELPGLASDGKTEEYLKAIEVFEFERQAVLDCQERIQAQYDENVLRCPGCGSSDEDPLCEDCQLIRMYPDPTILEQGELKTGTLSDVHGRVFDAYRKVLSGKLSLPRLFETLPPLEAHLRELDDMSSNVLSIKADDEEATEGFQEGLSFIKRIQAEVHLARNGVERIKQTGETLKMRDLIRGWDQVFESSVAIGTSLQHYSNSEVFKSFSDPE